VTSKLRIVNVLSETVASDPLLRNTPIIRLEVSAATSGVEFELLGC